MLMLLWSGRVHLYLQPKTLFRIRKSCFFSSAQTSKSGLALSTLGETDTFPAIMKTMSYAFLGCHFSVLSESLHSGNLYCTLPTHTKFDELELTASVRKVKLKITFLSAFMTRCVKIII